MRLPPVVVLLQPDEAGQATGQQGREHDDTSEQAKVMAVARQQEGYQRPAAKFDDVVIDAGGRDSTALRAALVLSNVLLVPFQPRSYDVWALSDIAALVDEARSVRDGLRACAVLNCADPGEHSSDNAEAAAAVAEVPQFEYLPTPLRRRKAFANAAGAGLCVLEAKPRDDKAVAELNSLLDAFF